MKLLATEIDNATVQLTYTDGRAVDDATQVLIVRAPLREASLKKSILWHQLATIETAREALDAERLRLIAEVQKAD